MAGSATLRRLERELESLDGSATAVDREGRESRLRVLPTGIGRLDEALPRGGLPRGRATEWWGPRSCGKAALLRAALERRCSAGDSVAWVDVNRTLYAPDWASLSREPGRFWVVRPPDAEEGGWCADLLLRSGAFDAVVLEGKGDRTAPGSGGGPGSAGSVVRLQRLAREADAALVVMDRVPVAALRLRFRPGRIEPVSGELGSFLPPVRPVWVRVGRGERVELPVLCPLPVDRTAVPPTRDRKGRR